MWLVLLTAALASHEDSSKMTLREVLESHSFTTFVECAEAAELVPLLEEDYASVLFTVFAPTNDAFDALINERFDQSKAKLLEDDGLADLIASHIILGSASLDYLTDGAAFSSLYGHRLKVKANTEAQTIMVDGVQLLQAESANYAFNGYVHAMSDVIVSTLDHSVGSHLANIRKEYPTAVIDQWTCPDTPECEGNSGQLLLQFSFDWFYTAGNCMELIPHGDVRMAMFVDFTCLGAEITCDEMNDYAPGSFLGLDHCHGPTADRVLRETCDWTCRYGRPMMLCMVVADPVGVHKLDGVLDYCYMEGVCTSDTEHVLLVFCQRTEGVAFVDDKAVEYEEDAATAEALDQALKDLGEMTTKHEELKEQNAELKEKHADLKDDHAELKEAQGGLTDEANSKLSSAETRLSGLRMKLEREINAREDAERDFKRAQGQVSSAWTFIWILLAGIAVLLAVSAYMTYRYQNAAKPTVVLVTGNRGDGSPSGGQQVAEEEAPTVVMGRTITNEKGADALAGNVVVP
jgi:uncharacterized surface protein with fasciclin (FAS1) repeats